MELNVGTRIAFNNGVTYEVKDFLGAGGEGIVYLVKSLADNRDYALKILLDSDENRKERKKRNIHALMSERANERFNKIGESYQIGYTFPLSFCEYEGKPLYVMELARGVTLESVMHSKTGTMRSKDMKYKLHLAQKIARAIEVLERLGKSYTNINWGNFMYDEGTDWLYVLDCENVASNTEIQEGRSFVLGNGYFMAPEVAFGLANARKNADRYALANMIFRIFINNRLLSPYDGKVMYSAPVRVADMLGVRDLVDDGCLDDAWSVFIFDETDHRNSIDDLYANANANQPNLQKERRKFDEVIRIWNSLDERLKVLFRQAFKDPLKKESYENRPAPWQWINAIEKAIGKAKNSGTVRTSAPNPSRGGGKNFTDYSPFFGGASTNYGCGTSKEDPFDKLPVFGGGASTNYGSGISKEDPFDKLPVFIGGGAGGQNGRGEVKPADPQKKNKP